MKTNKQLVHQSWQRTMMIWCGLLGMIFGYAQTTSVSVTTAGTSTWTCPPGVTSINIESWGGGGGGCGTSNSASRSAGGGAGGAYVKDINIAVTPGATYTVVVGAAGAGGVGNPSTGAPGAGGFTSFTRNSDSVILVKSVGGAAGAAATSTTGGAGGVGSTSGNVLSGVTGSLSYKGGDGGTGINGVPGTGSSGTAGTAAAGGGAGGSNGNGSGRTAGTGGGAGATALTAGTSGSGTAGSAPGGGGGGGISAAASAKNGGAGGAGKITISYATPANPTLTTSVSTMSLAAASGTTPSAQTFTVSATLLTDVVTISTATTNYLEISKDNTTFSNSVSITNPSDGTLGNTTIYVRLKSGLSLVNASENLTVASTNATSKTVAVSFVVYKNYYYGGSGDISSVSNWWTNTNGTGSNPTNFTADGQFFNIITNAASSGTGWAVGTGSKIILGASNVGPVTLTISNGAPITGPLDVSAASSGSNVISIQHDILHSTTLTTFTNPTWGTIDPSTIIEFSGTTNATLGGTNNLFNKTVKTIRLVNNAVGKMNGVANNIPTLTTELNIGAGCSFYTGQNSLSFINIASGGTVAVNGTLYTEKTTGYLSNDATASATSGAINFVGTISISFGTNGIVEYGRFSSTTAQTITPRTDYQNLTIGGLDSGKTFTGVTTIGGKLNINYYTVSGNRAITATGAITAAELVFNAPALQTVSTTIMPFLSNVTAPITFKNATGVQLGSADAFPNGLAYNLAGGLLKTGATAGFSDVLGTLNVSDNSTISFGTGDHSLQFASSSAVSWTAGKTLTVTGWTGSLGQSGTAGKLFFGSSNTGLTSGQLAQISFSNFPTASAIQLSTGEVVPQCANPTSGGTITGTTTICNGQTPSTFGSSSLPSGQIGNASLEYQWQMSLNNSTFSDISGANATTYSPGSLSATTYYLRLSRVGCQADWSGATASNTLTITVNTTSAPSAASSQSFCTGATVAQLAATGSSLAWYAASTGGSALASTDILSSGNYYVSQTQNSCESTRTTVSVTVNFTAAPAASSQLYCVGSTVAQLLATGTALKWYAGASDASPLASTAALSSATYYVSQTLDTCESTRTAVTVTIQNTGVPTAFENWLAPASTVAQLVATGSSLKWYTSNVSNSPLAGITAVSSGTYYVSQTILGCESNKIPVSVTVYSTGGLVPSISAALCGTTLSTIWTSIPCSSVVGANLYHFEISNGSQKVIYESTSNSFQLTSVSGGVNFGTTYSIRVAARVGANWSNFGSACAITTPASPAPTQISTSSCGVTLANFETNIYCGQPFGATGYRFQVSNGAYSETIDRPTNSFNFGQLTTLPSFSTTYSVRVAVQYNGAYGSYGNACFVTTPSAPAPTQLLASQCGTTLSSIYGALYCGKPIGAEGYRFEVTSTGGSTTVDRSTNNFNLMMISGGAAYSTTYSVRVAVLASGIYGAFGPSCSVTTPAASSSLSTMLNCGAQATNKWTALYSSQVLYATQYKYELTNGGQLFEITNTRNNFQFGSFVGWTTNTVYSVKVAVMINGTWQPYGTSCSITSPASFARHNSETEAISWTVKCFPNPSENYFSLNGAGFNQEPIHLQSFDLTGKCIDDQTIDAAQVENVAFGSSWNSGIYVIYITQGEEQSVQKLIKK
ncbi:MAG: hypothetical protein CFE24_06405 [Flavobacterium sp. BFFFF2]|nr:MAG: hypothetical protein CFE24_06405 [Flavobacterium sp. BFFFF2]